MKRYVYCLFFILVFTACKTKNDLALNFVSEFILQDSIQFNNTTIGGLSAVDKLNDTYFFVVDDAKKPRFLKATISIEKDTISSVNFLEVTSLKDSLHSFYTQNALDLETIFIDETKQEIYFSSEGNIQQGKNPTIFKSDLKGNFISDFQLPKGFTKTGNIMHNAAFEGAAESTDKKGFWAIMEAPLKADGEAPTFVKKAAPVRVTYFDKNLKKATKQFVYELEHITKPAKGAVNLNGATAILQYNSNTFFIVERTYQSGYGSYGNIVRIFEAIITEKSTNVIVVDSLKSKNYIPLKKRLLLNFDTEKEKLSHQFIDNIEGITLGPVLENGNPSLLLVSDDNFQLYGKQLNQFILLEILR
ncbi:esterase-like activity of phytase family protein [Polaribacter tangerinus]|uniref:esterase-like activity of phytase family protein n=1 Tax=Polaribacter tangerinus TaxID=1920034 RepID=UPI000B4B6A1D|nr:esterase-like activity of phytase family protein [Polaribacter tangerinus]